VGRATLIIAHRLSTVRRADRLVVLEHGRVVEEGSHANLLWRRAGSTPGCTSGSFGTATPSWRAWRPGDDPLIVHS
jgi:ABC-type multidrug transport system ATPase subunit